MTLVKRLRSSLARQGFADRYAIDFEIAEPGFVQISIPFDESVSDGQGNFHSGIVGALADIVGSYAGFTVLPETDTALSFEYKLNVLEPAFGERIVGRGTLVREGKQMMFSRADIFSVANDVETLCASGSASIMILRDTKDAPAQKKTGK